MKNINGNTVLMKEVNINIIRNILQKEINVTKQKLSLKTGLSVVTVSSVLQYFLETGEVYEDKMISSNGGRPAKTFCYNKNFSYILTVCTYEEKNINKAVISVTNLIGETIDKAELILDNPDIIFFDEIICKFIKKYSKIKGIGFCMPGQETEGKIAIHDYEKFVGLNLSEYFKNKYHLPMIFVNDVNAAVAGYLGCEEKREINSAVYVYFPQKYPAGAGLFFDGKLYKGFTGTAGEIKYIPMGIDWKNIDYSNKENVIEIVSKVLISLSAVFNPQTVIMCGEFLTEDILKIVEKKGRENMKEIYIPDISLSKNFQKDMHNGIVKLTLDLITPKLSLHE